MRRLGIVFAFLPLAACWVPKDVGRQMQAEIQGLRGDLQALKGNLDAAKATQQEQMQSTLQKLEDLSRALEEYNQSSRSENADFGTQLERMISDVQELRGAVEVNEHRIGETETKLNQTIATRIQAMQTQNANVVTEDAGANVLKDAPKGKKEQLAYASKLVKDGKVNDGRLVFRNIIKQWPKEVGITDEAEYRLGETYFDEKKYDAALREYIKVLDKFGNGALADHAYYKIGLCSLETGNLDDAQTFFSEIVTNHKKSPLAKDAKAKLDEVEKRIEANKKAKKSAPKKK